ncbi:MAG: CD3324 family protein [Spirochaetales bacterium]
MSHLLLRFKILPEHLLAEVQKYVQGEQLYIPNAGDGRAGWGAKNGTRTMLAQRDREIRAQKHRGKSIEELADAFGLSLDRVRKIVYRRMPSSPRR